MSAASPCPFCDSFDTSILPIEGKFYVSCLSCSANGPEKNTKTEALQAWESVDVRVIRLSDEKDDLENELAAYNALSGGKTAIEYAVWVDNWKKVFWEDFSKARSVYLAELQARADQSPELTFFAGIASGLFVKYFGKHEPDKSQ